MKPNIVVALLVGLVIGFAVGKVVSGPQGSLFAGNPTDESAFAIKSTDLAPGTFDGMTDVQKYAVVKVLNDNTCDCGCSFGTIAQCLKSDPNCPKSPANLRKAIALAKAGKNADQIQNEMFGKKGNGPARPRPPEDSTVYKVSLEDSPVRGNNEALVTIVEFSDYQCPFCGQAHQTVQQLLQQYGPRVRLVMRQNPLGMHPFAMGAALAALAANPQGKFWQMHDKMFENQRALDDASLEKYAQDVGLDVPRWKAARADPKLKQIIARDQAATQALGAGGTPAFFINGRKATGAKPIQEFRAIIDEELAKAEAMVKSGVAPDRVYAKIMEGASSAAAAAPAPAIKKVEIPDDAPFVGPKDAKVTIVEFSDFQCPFCSRALPAVHQITEAYPKDVKVVFRQFPLPMHSNARPAAEAALAANEQGKFWEMHDKLFANQQTLDRSHFEQWAKEIGLDVTKFKEALDSGRMKAKIDSDIAAGGQAGVNGTPTFFIDGRMQVGAPGFDQAKGLIDGDIAKANKLIAAGVKPRELYGRIVAEASQANP